MSQSRALSAAEAAMNVVVGWVVALGTQLALFPIVGLQASVPQHVALSVTFTLVSFLRSYALRRVFEKLT